MGEKVVCDALIEGGKATTGPPIGPTLGGVGVNLFQIVQKINDLTKDYTGLKVPVKIIADRETKQYEIEVGMPPTSALLLNAAKLQKGTGNAGKEPSGDVSMEEIIKIATSKRSSLTASATKAAVKTVLGTGRSCGLTVNGKSIKEITVEVDEGKFDKLMSKE